MKKQGQIQDFLLGCGRTNKIGALWHLEFGDPPQKRELKFGDPPTNMSVPPPVVKCHRGGAFWCPSSKCQIHRSSGTRRCTAAAVSEERGQSFKEVGHFCYPTPGAGISLKPSHLIKKALRQTSRQLDVTLVEEEPTQKVQNLFRPTISKKLIAWHGLGNSRTRTQEQIKHAKALTKNFLVDLGDTAIAFTDGSALKNPGPCGAGATKLCHYQTGIGSLSMFHSSR